MNAEDHERFQRMMDESLVGAISAEREQYLREHLATCTPCAEYLSASKRVLAGLGGFSFEVTPTLNARVLAAVRQRAELPDRGRFMGLRLKVWAAFAIALSMSVAGSASIYQVAKLLAVPMHVGAAQVQQGICVFWLLPSLCAAFCLLAVPSEKRGVA